MKKLIATISLLLCMIATPARAQTRALVGMGTGSGFGNLSAGPTAALEMPVLKHLQFDISGSYEPFEEHIKLGTGSSDSYRGGGTVWFGKGIGIDALAERSEYRVSITKSSVYAKTGLVYSKVVDTMPFQFTFNYVKQLHNGIYPDNIYGTETAHLQAGEFDIDSRLGCNKAFCYRLGFVFQIGTVLNQSNPVCDGTFGVTGGPNGGMCPRQRVSSGAFGVNLSMEFWHHKGHEHDPL